METVTQMNNLFWKRNDPEEVKSESHPVQDLLTYSSEDSEDREQWGNTYEFMITVLGYNIGLGNIWRFPYLCYKHGGGAFLICYCVAAITVGMPYFFLELALGQSRQAGALGVWKICPLFKGIGWAMLIISFYSNIYYIIVLAWALLYFFNAMKVPMPWQTCDHWWNTKYCIPATCKVIPKCSVFPENETVSSVQEFWERRLLQITDRIEDVGNLQWELAGTLFLIWVICYFCLWKGIRMLGKIMYVILLAPYAFIVIILGRALFLPGAMTGVKYYLVPNFGQILHIEVWFDAVTQVLYSMGIGYGALVAFGSHNDYHNDIYREMLILASVDVSTSILMGFAFFAIIGFLSFIRQKPISAVAMSGPEIVFIVYPVFALELTWSPFWSAVILLLIITTGVESQIGCLVGFITAIEDEFQYSKKYKRELLVLGICAVKYIFGLTCVTQGGIYVFNLMDNYAAAGWNICTVVFFEGCVVTYFYGVNKFYSDLKDMFGFKPFIWWKICWIAISPSIVLVLGFLHLIQYKRLKYHNYSYPVWADIMGWILSLSSIIWIPLYVIYYIIRQRGSLKQRLKKSLKPSYELDNLSTTLVETDLEIGKPATKSSEEKLKTEESLNESAVERKAAKEE